MNLLLLSILLSFGGLAVFLVTFLWERSWFKKLGNTDAPGSSELAKTLERERNAIEWVRAIGATVLLIGILVCMWA